MLIQAEHFRSWSPDDPFLYDVTVTLGEDRVESYFALRKISVVERQGQKVLALNDRPIFLSGSWTRATGPTACTPPPATRPWSTTSRP